MSRRQGFPQLVINRAAARPTMEPQLGLLPPCSSATPESQPSGLGHPEAACPPGRHQGALDSDPQVAPL